MNKYPLLFMLLFSAASTAQTTVESVLQQIDRNNSQLAFFRQELEAERLDNKTDNNLQNPELTFNYLLGSPSVIGNRTDFSVQQTFDFPISYAYRNQLNRLKNEQSVLEYQKHRLALFADVRLRLADLVYANVKIAALTQRLARADSMASSFKARFDAGAVGILDFNKVQMHRLNLRKELELEQTLREDVLTDLAQVNGGIRIDFSNTIYPIPVLNSNFDLWYAAEKQMNPMLQWLSKDLAIQKKSEKLQSALGLPKLGAGYLSERVVGEHFQGITLGVSVPLWENKGKVQAAKARTQASELAQADAQMRHYAQMKALHAKVLVLNAGLTDYCQTMLSLSNANLLQKALNAGEISLVDYLYELTSEYETTDRMYEMEYARNKVVAQLQKYSGI